MNDQAERLRYLVQQQLSGKSAKTIGVISGKGGVGKSNISLNMAIALSLQKQKVLIIDLDVGMGNIELLSGIPAPKTIVDFFQNRTPLNQIITKGPANISYISGGNGLDQYIQLSDWRLDEFLRELKYIMFEYDFIFFDIGAGMQEETARMLTALDKIFVVVTPEPTSIMDAYSTIKFLSMQNTNINCTLIGNRMKDQFEHEQTMKRIMMAMNNFLKMDGKEAGFIYDDPTVSKAVKAQIPFLLYKPSSPASKQIKLITQQLLLSEKLEMKNTRKPFQFINQLKSYFLKK